MRSLNFDERKLPVTMLVLHYTGMKTSAEALARLCSADAKVSAHYMVDEDGTAHALVDEGKRAWHAGVSSWRGIADINSASVGVEIVNPGHEFGYLPFPEAQMRTVAALSQEILSRHSIPARNVVGHSDVAPVRKEDPGELFNWHWLAKQGVGLWPEDIIPTPDEFDASDVQFALGAYGYDVPQTGEWDEVTRKVIVAFQRHFRPLALSGAWDAECNALLERLLEIA